MDESRLDPYSSRNRIQGEAALNLSTGTVKLTDLASCGGCAAKYSAARLEQLLAGFVPAEAEDLLVGLAPADDAAVYRLDDERALIFTLDFFPPVVDDPADYGAIAATNALNDVFAMGGTPLLALSIAAFPEELPMEMLAEIFAAADAQVRAAGGLLAGGHTIRDAEPKYGLAVVGTVHPNGIWPKNGARPGDCALPDEAARHRADHDGAQARRRRLAAARARDPLDADAEQRGRRRPPRPRAERRHGRHGLRALRARARGRRPERRTASRLESERFPAIDGALDVARKGVRTSGDPRNRDFAGAARLASTGSRTRSTRSGTTRRRRAACSSRSRRSGARRSRRSSRRGSSSSAGSAGSRKAPASSSSELPRDDPRALPALSQRPPRVPEGRGGALVTRSVVGITNPDPSRIKPEDSDPLRHLPESNPYSYVERLLMVKAAAARRGARARPRARDPVPGQRARALAGLRARGRDAVHPALLRLGRDEARPVAGGRLRGRRARRGRREGRSQAPTCARRCARTATGRRSSRRGWP